VQRQRHEQVGLGPPGQRGELFTEVCSERQAVPVLEGLDELVEREVVAKRRQRAVVMRGIGEAAPTDFIGVAGARQRLGAACAAGRLQAWQIGSAGGANDVLFAARRTEQAILRERPADAPPQRLRGTLQALVLR
jgi:hypothetical protein